MFRVILLSKPNLVITSNHYHKKRLKQLWPVQSTPQLFIDRTLNNSLRIYWQPLLAMCTAQECVWSPRNINQQRLLLVFSIFRSQYNSFFMCKIAYCLSCLLSWVVESLLQVLNPMCVVFKTLGKNYFWKETILTSLTSLLQMCVLFPNTLIELVEKQITMDIFLSIVPLFQIGWST